MSDSRYRKDHKKHRRRRSNSRSRSHEKESDRRHNKYSRQDREPQRERKRSPNRLVTHELGNRLTDFSLRSVVKDKLNKAKNEERKREEGKFSFNFTKKENNHLDPYLKQKMIEAIDEDNPYSLETAAAFHKFSNDAHHLNAMYSNDYANKKTEEILKEKPKPEKADAFDINDDDLFSTFK